MHPGYNTNTFDNDIGVICLPNAAVINDNVNTACMATGSSSETTNNCYATGKLKTMLLIHIYRHCFLKIKKYI